MKESTLQAKIIKYIKSVGGYAVNIHGNSYQSTGTPDVIACYKGRFIAIETKVGNNKQHNAQLVHMKRIQKADGVVIVPYTFDEFINQWETVVDV